MKALEGLIVDFLQNVCDDDEAIYLDSDGPVRILGAYMIDGFPTIIVQQNDGSPTLFALSLTKVNLH